jgi:hypothetical protein
MTAASGAEQPLDHLSLARTTQQAVVSQPDRWQYLAHPGLSMTQDGIRVID